MDCAGTVSRGEPVSVRGKSDTGHRLAVAAQGEDLGTGRGIPDLDALVFTGGCQPPPMGTEYQLENGL